MKEHMNRSRTPYWLMGCAVTALAFSLAFPTGAVAQGRGPGDRSGSDRGSSDRGSTDRGSSDRGSSRTESSNRGSSRSDSSRSESVNRGSSRSDSSRTETHRDSSPTRQNDTSPRNGSSRTDTSRDSGVSRQQHDEFSFPRRDSGTTTRQGSGSDPFTRRDTSTTTRQDRTTTGRDPFERTGRDSTGRTTERSVPGGSTSQGSGSDPFNRTRTPREGDRNFPGTRTGDNSRATGRDTFPVPGRGNVGVNPAPSRDRGRDIFTRSYEGRHYDNGVTLRSATYVTNTRINYYFVDRRCYFPHYVPSYSVGYAYYSPYSFYFGVLPAYIDRTYCIYRPPVTIFVDTPIYVDRVYRVREDDYYSERDFRDAIDRAPAGLERAVDDIREAFRYGNINPIVDLTDPGVKVAIFRQGKYEYSLETNDYLDMTRDALRTTETVSFDLTRVRRRSEGVYSISGKHVYVNRDGERRAVYMSFVLEYLRGRWTLTQVGNSPDRIQEP